MEVEIKSRINDPQSVERDIIKLGGRFVKEVSEEDWYFNHPCIDFSKTDEALRIRSDGTLTYKGKREDSITKSREEINVKIEDTEKMRTLLEKLGFTFVAKVVKKRKYYRIGKITVTIDDVENLGKFVEVECIGEYEPCLKEVLKIKSEIGLDNLVKETYLEMLLEYQSGST